MFDRNEPKDVELTPELAALERQLAGMSVAPLRVDRDQLMFEAGRAAGRAEHEIATVRVAGAPRWFWPSAAATLAAASVVLAAMLVWQGDSALVAQRAAKPQAADLPLSEAPMREDRSDAERLAASPRRSVWSTRPAGGYLEKRFIALTRGVGELRSDGDGEISLQPGDSLQPATSRELLRDLVPPRAPPSHSNS